MENVSEEFIANPKKALFKISLPIIIGSIAQTAYNLVDTAFVGRLGAEAIAALTFSFPLFFFIIALDIAVETGMGSRISRFIGEKRKADAENAAMHGIAISLILAIAVFVLGSIFLRPLFIMFGATGNVLELAMQYMSLLLFASFFIFPAYALDSVFVSQGITRVSMIIQISSLALNVILDPLLIYGFKLGIRGAAIATICSFLLSLALYIYFLHKKSYLKITFRGFKFSWQMLKEILIVGLPTSFSTMIVSLYVIFLNRAMVYFGTDYIAAFGIASELESVAMLPVFGMSYGLMALVGMYYGAKRYDLVRNISWYALKIALFITVSVGVLFFVFSPIFFRLFTVSDSIVGIGTGYMRIDVLTFPLMAIMLIAGRVTQGMGKGFPGLIISLVRIFVVAVPLAYLFVFVLGYGYLSIAVAMVIGGTVASISGIGILIYSFRKLHDEKGSRKGDSVG